MKTIEERREDFLKRARNLFGNRFNYDLSNYTSCNSIITITDTTTGESWDAEARNHLRTVAGKPNDTRGYKADEILKRIEENFGKEHFEFLDPIVDFSSRIRVKCLVHNVEFITTPKNLYHGHNGCPVCYSELCSETRWTKKVDQKESSIKIKELLDKGWTFIEIGAELGISGHQAGVIAKKFGIEKPAISTLSSGERHTIAALKSLNIVADISLNTTRIHLEGRSSNYVIPDFIFSYKSKPYWIEYNGTQHYLWCDHFNNHSREEFQRQLKRDQNVRDYCKENNIILIEIPYILDTYIKVEEFLDKTIIQGIDPNTLIDYSKLYK